MHPRASLHTSRIGVALKLLEASAGWLNRRDPVQLRRALLVS